MTTVSTVGNLVAKRDLTNAWIKLILEYFNSVYLGFIVHSLVSWLGHGCLFDKPAFCLKEIELFLKKKSSISTIAGNYVIERWLGFRIRFINLCADFSEVNMTLQGLGKLTELSTALLQHWKEARVISMWPGTVAVWKYFSWLHNIISLQFLRTRNITLAGFFVYRSLDHHGGIVQMMVFWDFTLYSITCLFLCFGGTWCLHLHGDWIWVRRTFMLHGTETHLMSFGSFLIYVCSKGMRFSGFLNVGFSGK
jgi:hypothetical protein